ncbi:hypothetical protein Sjap_010150 [Stephania japonica]|uniref:TF-B3 domain-containing protein n=1 Tax=Stephania japonica TaxID=461633 RepID=A0AAP0JB35_9MAGN
MVHGNRFFRRMGPGYLKKLRIPKVFRSRRLNQIGSCKRAKLCIQGKTWRVKVKRDDEQMCLKEGWKSFVKDNEIGLGDLLVFEHKGDMIFDVLLFDRISACEKDCSTYKTSNNAKACENNEANIKQEDDPLEATEAEAYATSLPHFIKKITVRHSSKCPVEIPTAFARSNGLCLHNGRMITLRDPQKKNFQDVDLRVGCQPRQRVTFGSAIFRFFKENNIQVGDVCVFELDPTAKKKGRIVFDVKVLNGQTPTSWALTR